MPLLNRRPFVKNRLPPQLSPHDEIFYCQSTHEVFLDYEEFFQRIILCNSLVWTCETTGRPGLTFDEAIESERRAKRILIEFPVPLKLPLLCLATCTQRSRLADLCDDVFTFIKDRYFLDENVEHVTKDGTRRQFTIQKIFHGNTVLCSTNGAGKKGLTNGSEIATKSGNGEALKPSLLRYTIKDSETGQTLDVKADSIFRKKGSYTREKNKLFFKHACNPHNGSWGVKEKYAEKYKLSEKKFADIFIGSQPRFKASVKRKLETMSQPSVDKYLESEANKKKLKITDEERERMKEENKIKIEERKKIKMEERVKAREQKMEERRIITKYNMEWSRPRDDLLCEDLREMPTPTEITCDIPQKHLGETLMTLEFFHVFGELLETKDQFPHGLDFKTIQTALISNQITSPLKDIFQFLLETIFSLQDSNEDISAEENSTGTSIRTIPIDSFTLTEILRLHLLSSGSKFARLDGCLPNEDPALLFKINHPEIIKELAINNVFDLSIENKLKLINVLILQIMSHDFVRQHVEESYANARQTKNDLRMLKASEGQRERECSLRLKKYSDARALQKFLKLESENKPSEIKENGGEDEPVDEELEKVKKMTERQWEDYSERIVREETKKKEAFLKKERELLESLAKYLTTSCVAPIGRDRAFRRYWQFSCFPGLFVEDNDMQFMGKCLQSATPYNPELYLSIGAPNVNLASMRQYIERTKEDYGVNSDKENEDGDSQNGDKVTKKSKTGHEVGLSEQNGSSVEMDTVSDDVDKTPVFGMCTANEETCPVHSRKVERCEWKIFSTVESVESLITSLNTRGCRERELLENLKSEKWRFYDNLSSSTLLLSQMSKSNNNKNVEEESKNANKMLELNIRDSLIDLEEKIYHGTLGNLKVKDRTIWRTTIESERYDMQAESIEWCGNTINCAEDLLEENEKSDEKLLKIKKLCCALLQLSQGIDTKYLKPPLGEDADSKKKMAESLIKKLEKKALENQAESDKSSTKENESTASTPTLKRTAFEKWTDSLMSSTSHSQIFLHISTLERSVEWSRSILNAKCRICRRKTDAENMLLCDSCDRGHHLYCLKPALMVIPKGNWFCSTCLPKQTPRKRKVSVKSAERESSEEEEEEESFTEQKPETEESIMEDGSEASEVEAADSEDERAEENLCDICGKSGKLIDCQKCDLHYHMNCTSPKLKKQPRGKWTCSKCTNASKSEVNERKSKRAKIVLGIQKKSSRKSKPQKTQFEDSPSESSNDLRPARRTSSGRRSLNENGALNYKACDSLLNELTKHEDGWLFLRPVTKKDAADYHLIVKNPMDFGTMRGKLNNVTYKDNAEFLTDTRLVFHNCDIYNPDESDEFNAGRRLKKFFESRVKQLGLSSKRDSRSSNDEPPYKKRR